MKGTIWAVFVAGVGAMLWLAAAGSAARPASPANSTEATAAVLSQTAPFAGLLLLLAAVGALLTLAFKI